MASSDIFTRKNIEKANLDYYSNTEAEAAVGWDTPQAQASNYDILLEVAGRLEPKQRILDIGCGSGYLYRSLDVRAGIDYVGIDVRKDTISSLKKEFKDDKNRFLNHTLDSYQEKEKPQMFD